MLAKIAPRFVISRVIQNSYLAENQAIQLLKFSFDSKDMELEMIDPQNYDVRIFLSRYADSMDIFLPYRNQKDSKINMKKKLTRKHVKDLEHSTKPYNYITALEICINKQEYYTAMLRETMHQVTSSLKESKQIR